MLRYGLSVGGVVVDMEGLAVGKIDLSGPLNV